MISRLLFAMFLLAPIEGAAAAGSVTVGTVEPCTSQCAPFGCTGSLGAIPAEGLYGWGTEYEQLYNGLYDFSQETLTLTGISFYVGNAPSGAVLNSGTYTFSLSLVTIPVANPTFNQWGPQSPLGTGNLSANLGSDNTVVYSGPLPAISNGMLTITFTTPFTYSGSDNLLLDVQSTDATNNASVQPGATFVTNGTECSERAQAAIEVAPNGVVTNAIFSSTWANRYWYPQNNGLVTTFYYE